MDLGTMRVYARRAARGGFTKLEACPETDWSRLDPKTLNMGCVRNCVLAQLFGGSHAKGRRALGLANNQEGAQFGFWWHPDVPTKHIRTYYATLTEAWLHLLAKAHREATEEAEMA